MLYGTVLYSTVLLSVEYKSHAHTHRQLPRKVHVVGNFLIHLRACNASGYVSLPTTNQD